MAQIKRYLFLLILLPFLSSAQTIQVKKEAAQVEGKSTSGYQLALAAEEEEVRDALSKYLKAIGKTKTSGDYILLTDAVFGGKPFANTIYATTKQIGSTTAAWLGIASESGEGSNLDAVLEKLTHDFGVTYHRQKIQTQIDESLRALQTVERQQSRLLNQNRDLNNKIESNKREKTELEQALVENKVELEELVKKLEANARAQDSIAVANDQIRQVVEMHKARQRKIQ